MVRLFKMRGSANIVTVTFWITLLRRRWRKISGLVSGGHASAPPAFTTAGNERSHMEAASPVETDVSRPPAGVCSGRSIAPNSETLAFPYLNLL